MDYPGDVAILASYFVLIAVLVWRIKPLLTRSYYTKTRGVKTLFGLAMVSFIATWTYMIRYFEHSYREWSSTAGANGELSFVNSISHWLHDVSLFDDAWRTVSQGGWPWLWSHQLCLFTVIVWTPFLVIEGSRRGVPWIWAFMLLGQVVAISVASALFFAVVLVSPSKKDNNTKKNKGGWLLLAISSLVGLLTIILTPFLVAEKPSGFLPNLLAMHAILFLPIMLPSSYSQHLVIGIYMAAAGANFAVTAQQWLTAVQTSNLNEALQAMVHTFFAHPAQSSISADVLCANIVCMAWMLLTNNAPFTVWSLVALTPVLSSAVTMPLFLAISEYHRTTTTTMKKHV